MDGQDRRLEVSKGLDRLLDGVRDIVELEVQEDRRLVLGDAEHALLTIGAEELEAELYARGEAADVASNGDRAVNILRVERDEDRSSYRQAPAPLSVGRRPLRPTAGSRPLERVDHAVDATKACVRMISHVGRKPRRKTISSRIGILMSAWMSPQRFSVTEAQLRVAKEHDDDRDEHPEQGLQELHPIGLPPAHLRRSRVHSHKPVRRKTESLHRMRFRSAVEGEAHSRQSLVEGGEKRFI